MSDDNDDGGGDSTDACVVFHQLSSFLGEIRTWWWDVKPFTSFGQQLSLETQYCAGHKATDVNTTQSLTARSIGPVGQMADKLTMARPY